MSDIFNEANMRHILQKYVFSGETLDRKSTRLNSSHRN